MNSKEALDKLYDGYQYGMNGRSLYDIIKLDLERLEMLEKQNKLLNETKDSVNKVLEDLGKINEENAKLKKAIEILGDNFPIRFLGYNKYGAKPYEIMINGYIQGFDKEPYELLKEVFKNEINK